MTAFASDFLRALDARGLIDQATDAQALDAALTTGRVSGYIGFDCTAPSLHVGSLMQIMQLRRLQQSGHRPIIVLGGGTTKIGDPSFRDDTRPLLDDAGIARNKAGIQAVFERYLSFDDGPTGAIMVDNDEWLSGLAYIPFLREVGRHFSVNRMLTFDSVRTRLEREQSLSFLEFNYMILQAYDFVELARRHGCTLQMGGSDQWGNIVNGVELGHRMGTPQLFGLTCPLLTTSSGAKMGKTAAGAVWLNEAMLPSFDFWQYWRNAEDADVGRFLRIFTDLPLDEIARLEALEGAERNEAKKILATEVTAMARGRAAADAAAQAAAAQFGGGGVSLDLPTVAIDRAVLESGLPIATLAAQSGLTASASEARRQIEGGGLKLNDQAVSDPKATVSLADLLPEGVLKLSLGRKKHLLVRPA